MAVSDAVAVSAQRRRRRRRQDKPAVAARLVLDDHVKTDVGIVSDDLVADLFPQLANHSSSRRDDQAPNAPAPAPVPGLFHVAIAPWAPAHSPETTNWTIVPVTKSSALAHSTVQFSPSSLALQSFALNLKQVAPSKLSSHSRSGIEILVLDVAAIALDTVFVSLEGPLAKRLEDGEGTFFREHPASGTRSKRPLASLSPAERLTEALRNALGTLKVVHTGDLFSLPLPPHPVTHVSPNPGKIALCEPVAQGLLAPTTKIIVSRGRLHSRHHFRTSAPIQSTRTLNGVAEDDSEDTSTDQFYSAAEERDKTDAPTEDTDSVTTTETEEEDYVEDEELSDDSMDEMISLETPTLPPTAVSGVSSLQPGSPTTIGRGRKTNVVTTPGSVFSSFTATTARPDRPRGRLFKAQGLMKALPAELLYPKPAPEDDEEARVYVAIRDLPRIGCVSGNWVRIETAEEPPLNGFGTFGLGSFVHHDDEANWRPARVFGLPEGYSQRNVTRIPSSKHDSDRRPSFFESQIQKPSQPVVYTSPILLANLDSPPYLRISPLKRVPRLGKPQQAKVPDASQPPYAREVIIQQVRTPGPIERDVQTAVMAGLMFYFERKLRILRSGDLIAVPIDSQLGKSLQETTAATAMGESVVEDALSLISSGQRYGQKNAGFDEVAWFRVSHVQAIKPDEAEETTQGEQDVWGSVASVEISLAHLEQSGSVTCRLPGVITSTWRYYLGLKALPCNPSIEAPLSPPFTLEGPHQFVSPLRRRLRELLAAATSKRAIHLKMPPLAILLVSSQRNVGKAATATDACLDLGLHAFSIDAYDILNEGGAGGSDVKTEGLLKVRAERAMSCGPEYCALLVHHIEALTADRMVASMREILANCRVLIATTTELDKVPDGIRGLFTHELEMGAPDEREREGILRSIVDDRGLLLDADVELGTVALKTAALVAGDLVDVVGRALVAQRSRLEKLASRVSATSSLPAEEPRGAVTVRDVQVAGGAAARGLTRGDFEVAVDAARRNFADAIGAPKIPNVTWDDVGGLGQVKDAIAETIELPLERPELFAKGMKKRSGILFYGPPGTGKTLLAKAIATEYSLNFFSVKGPELLNMYIGESEANVRRVFQRARDARPCVVFFDELDSVAPKRGNQGDSGGVMDRIVSQLLAELDGMSGGGDDATDAGGVFVIGATNRPDLLDQALLRPGRFDKMLYLGVSDTHEKQLTIMEALTRKFTLHPSVSLRTVAEQLPFTYTGADFYALCSDAMLKAVTRQAARVDAKIKALNERVQQQQQQQQQRKEADGFSSLPPPTSVPRGPITTAAFFDHFATAEDVAVMVTERDFLDAHRELIPSVSAGELAHYERVRAAFEGTGATAGGAGNNASSGSGGGGYGNMPLAGHMFPGAGRRTVSGTSSRGSGKGKGKTAALSSLGGGKGKGKGVSNPTAAELDDGDGDGESDDYGGGFHEGMEGNENDQQQQQQGANRRASQPRSDKGKGKAVFLEDGAGEDEGLYDD